MKKTLRAIIGITLLVLASGGLFAQGDQQSAAPVETVDDGRQKYALVIGNGAYTGITRLNNPVNDAADISAALRDLGFTVDQVINAGRVQMEEAVTRLKNRLGGAQGSYGFFYYAGHGVQSNGENYLIPVDANIPGEAYLRDRSMPMQAILDELNYVGNSLNIVVLDACRDNPFGWRRSGSRGLQVVSNQPAKSIIVYATSAGSTAADGTGRNGLFTTHLLNNLKKPGLSVRDMFDQTGADVYRASGGEQVPAIYSQFFDVAYLGTRPAPVQPAAPPVVNPQPSPQPAARPSPAPAVTSNAKAYNDSGNAYYDKGDYDRAIADYTQAIRLDPNFAEAYFNRGDAFDEKGDYDTAIADYTQAIRLDPNYTRAYYYRGISYDNKKDYDRAIADYTQAIRLDPNYTAAYNNRGVAYYNKEDYDRAIADYTQAIRLDPNYAKAYFNRGDAFDEKGDYDTAIADYTQAIRLDPNYTAAYCYRGISYRHKGDYDRAIADYTQAIRLDPNYATAYNNRGVAYENKKDYNRAIADYEAALRIDPNYTLARNNLEDARRARGY
ncbi:MAG: tetratricopeptide repeat protein [Treponema sp.]|jgi:tetratricopeptide (TPR) repeat protein|nr:tetratricopeptide repeat protein [Treponema sp.]